MKKLFCLSALAIIALTYIKAQTNDSLLRKPNLRKFDLPNNSGTLRNIPFEFKAPSFTNPLDQYSLKIAPDSTLVAMSQPRIERADEDNMPILNPGNNFPMKNYQPDPGKHYYLRIYDPKKARPLILPSEK